MYLNQLNLTEKNAFMSLSIHAANADGVVDDSETLLFQNFCKEMEHFLSEEAFISAMGHTNDGIRIV